MPATLVAALSLAASLTIDVPFVPQTEALCGGAAVAMVFRYWGDAHADVAQFAPLVEQRPGSGAGIADDVLVGAVRDRGWRTEQGGDSIAALRSHLVAREPVIVLLAERRNRYHYVVVTGVGDDAVVVHDPSWGPSRRVRTTEFERLWTASNHWSLVVLPSETRPTRATEVPRGAEAVAAASSSIDPCDGLLEHAIEEVRARGLDRADEILGRVRQACPTSAGPYRELAGVRFAERRWQDASSLAREAIRRQPDDRYALDLLGSSRFMQDDPAGALEAWNRIGKPRLDLVRIDGVHRSRYQAIVEALGLKTDRLLTADAFLQAQHRLDALPDRSSARLAVRPGEDGFASVDVALAERAGWPNSWSGWSGAAIRAGVDREVSLAVPGFTGQGELWSASWRWWSNRPRVALAFAAPRVGGLPGVWTVDASWEVESYDVGTPALVRESRTHGGLSVSDWMTGHLRYAATAGVDAWSSGRRAASIGGSLERRWARDRMAIAGSATTWMPLDERARFAVVGLRSTLRSSVAPAAHDWQLSGTVGAERASDAAPMSVWPGAGDGHARAPLARAHPLLDDGTIDISSGPPEGGHDGTDVVYGFSRTIFGRSLQYANADVVRWLPRPQLARVGLATFVDLARSTRSVAIDRGVAHVDVGGGLRVHMPGADRVLRIDVAHGLRDGANAVTVGWTF